MKYIILKDFDLSEKIQNDILIWYKEFNGANADRWSDVNKHSTSDIWCVPVPENYQTDLELFEELPDDWYSIGEIL